MQMVLRTLSVGELRSPNSTPRHHSKKQRAKARALFAEQGIVVPIIVDDRMRIIDGVLRFETAKELGLDELNAVVVSNSTDAQLLQLELSLNRLAEDSAWNAEHLKTKFEHLIEYQVDLTFTGFETAEIDNILSFEVIEPEDQDWASADLVTQVGDIWRVGDHIVACGNALYPDEVLGGILASVGLAKACITDPPYNVPTSGHIRTTQNTPSSPWQPGKWMIRDSQSFCRDRLQPRCPILILVHSITCLWIGGILNT